MSFFKKKNAYQVFLNYYKQCKFTSSVLLSGIVDKSLCARSIMPSDSTASHCTSFVSCS